MVTTVQDIDLGLRQVATILSAVPEDRRADPTPCSEWTVAELTDHLLHTAGQLVVMARGGEVDWSTSAEHVADPAPAWAARSDELREALQSEESQLPLGMVAAELSVHTWDLATALGRSTDDLNPSLPEDGFAFMSMSLTDEQRGGAFDPEKPAPDGANAYERLAAFAGRTVQLS